MKKKLISASVMLAAAMALAPMASAQGVIVHKKNGSTIKVPYAELDSITTYDYNENPGTADGVKTFDANGVSFSMVFVQGGSFEMGATAEQKNGYTPDSDESPVHLVTLSDYYIGQTEVTQELWQAVMGASPTSSSSWKSDYGLGAKYPAYYISYTDCQQFISKLNSLTGQQFRMPTEAEWEYAARGGSKSGGYVFSGSNTLGEVGWYTENSGSKTHEVATKSPNELGIYDMSGNVWEWCSDWKGDYSSGSQTNPVGPSTGSSRVSRGGGRYGIATSCRVSYRGGYSPGDSHSGLGLRLAL